MRGEKRHSYRFKAFRLEVEERQLLNHNQPVPLTPKAFDVLVALVEQSGHLVEKEELLQSVWSDSFVEEANIARIVYTLRKKLGDDGNGNKYIETVAKKGYRFIAEVKEFRDPAALTPKNENGRNLPAAKRSLVSRRTPPASAAGAQISSAATAKRAAAPAEGLIGISRIVIFAAGFVSAIVLLFFLLVQIDVQPISSLPKEKTASIAVLPPQPVGAARREKLYEIGIADSLINRLSTIDGFAVRPLNATRKYAEIEQDPLVAGKEQKVDYVLVSNYRLTDGKILVTARLYNTASAQIEETYLSEKATNDISAAQSAVADEIGILLHKRLAGVSANSAATPEQSQTPD